MSNNTCNNCMLLKKGDCFGKAEICEDFRYSPSMSSADKENWPIIMITVYLDKILGADLLLKKKGNVVSYGNSY